MLCKSPGWFPQEFHLWISSHWPRLSGRVIDNSGRDYCTLLQENEARSNGSDQRDRSDAHKQMYHLLFTSFTSTDFL